MQTFVALDGNTYPFSQIARVRQERRKITFVSKKVDGSRREREGEVVVIEMMNERTVEVETYTYDSWDRLPISTFSAAPGTYIVQLDDEEPNGYLSIPVLGWAIASDTGVYPVTTDGVNDGNSQPKAVLLPTGEVTQFEGTYESVSQWLEAQKDSAAS